MRRSVLLVAVGLLVFAVSFIARLPVSLLAERLPPEVRYTAASGTLWSGEVRGLRVDDQPLGQATFRLHFLPLLRGEAAARIDLDGSGLEGEGQVAATGERVALSDFEGSANLAAFDLRDFFGAPLVGTAEVDVQRLVYGMEGCVEAELTASTDALTRSLGSMVSDDLTLRGEGRCDERTLVLPMTAESAQGSVEVLLSLAPDGEWTSSMAITPTDSRLGTLLGRAGFEETRAGTWSMTRSGGLEQLL